jgi:outer membrane murein-binding lipoprotein Lpp
MHRHLIAVAAVLLLAGPALAQDAASGPGRFQIAPSEQGFTRLDTETGSLSHCTKSDGVWRCEPLGDASGLAQKVDDLSGRVTQLSTDLDALATRVDALAGRVDALAARPSGEAAPAEDEAGLVEQAVRRLLDMVRQMKHPEVGST